MRPRATYYVSRAGCFLKLNKYPELCNDAKMILQTQSKPEHEVYGQFYLGVAYTGLGYYDEAMKCLHKGKIFLILTF